MSCFSKPDDPAAKKTNSEINRQLKKEEEEYNRVTRILLLGPGESGKTTFMRQMKIIHNVMTDQELLYSKRLIVRNIQGFVISIVEGAQQIDMKLSSEADEFASQFLLKSEDSFFIDEFEKNLKSFVPDLKRFFFEEITQAVVARGSQFQLPESCSYFFNQLDRIGSPDYVPSLDDILRMRVKTTGISENYFDVDTRRLQVIDVGGQRIERKKWLPLFDEVIDAVIFFAAISEYDQFLSENSDVPRMKETLDLFQEIVSKPQFASTPIILLLNKWDLFEQKLKTIPLKDGYFKEYTGSNNPNEAFEFIKQEFTNRYKGTNIYVYQTTAIDTTGMLKVVASIKDALLQKLMGHGGMFEQTIVVQGAAQERRH